MDRDRGRRFDDGEVVRYGAGESWRPTPRGGERERSPPRRMRSPARDRDRSRPRSPRGRTPPVPGSDSYVPGRFPPRRRSPSRGPGDRYRRERSRERESPPRRRERSRSLGRRSPPRRSLSRRGTPRRGSPPRRVSPLRSDRYERPRSPPPPRREWERDREWDRDRVRERERSRDRDREMERRDERRDDRRSRSPMNRERRERSPIGRATPTVGTRGGSYRPSRSPSRRPERYQSYRRPTPPRETGIASAVTSQSVSRRNSPRPSSIRARSPLQSNGQSPAPIPPSGPMAARDAPRPAADDSAPAPLPRSPPRGPAAMRAPPTGPAASRGYGPSSSSPVATPRHPPQTPSASQHRAEVTSPTHPPSGPRGYVPPSRGGYAPRGGRGSWSQSQSRHVSGPSPGPQTPSGPSNIPTGPRASATPSASAPAQNRPFNPPTGPAAGTGGEGRPRQTLAQSLMSTMPPLVPGGKLDPSMSTLVTGVSRDLEPHMRKLRDEEEKLREELRVKQERLRKNLYMWEKLGRDSRAWEMRSDLSERSMKNLAGEGTGGAAF